MCRWTTTLPLLRRTPLLPCENLEAEVGIGPKTTANCATIARFSGLIKRTLSLLERTPSLPFGAHFDARDILRQLSRIDREAAG